MSVYAIKSESSPETKLDMVDAHTTGYRYKLKDPLP